MYGTLYGTQHTFPLQLIRHRADRALFSALTAHSNASVAFTRLSRECEALLGRLRQAAADAGVDQVQIDSLVVALPRSAPETHPDADGAELHLLDGSLPPSLQVAVLQRALARAHALLEGAAVVLDKTQQDLLSKAEAR